MKRLLLLLLFPISLCLNAQTDSIEKETLHDYFVKNKMYVDDYSKAGKSGIRQLKVSTVIQNFLSTKMEKLSMFL